MSSSSRVLVTGVSGFTGAHVVDKLLQEGYLVRGTARSGKVSQTQENFDKVYGKGKVEVAGIDDLIGGDFTAALKDVNAVIHVASPAIGRVDAESAINGAVEGTVRVLRQGQELGIKHFAIVSSVLAAVDYAKIKPGLRLTESDWNDITREEALSPDCHPVAVYCAAKALAEKEVWKFADEHPDLNITTFAPTTFSGSTAPGQLLQPGDLNALSTLKILYELILPDSKHQTVPIGYINVRDIATALVAGIKTPGRNRILLTGEWFEVKDAVDFIATARPELKDRLPTLVASAQTGPIIDNSRAEEILGIKVRPWKETVLEAVDFFVKLEKDWKSQGVDLEAKVKEAGGRV